MTRPFPIILSACALVVLAALPAVLRAQSGGTSLAQEQAALLRARAQGDEARRRSERYEARARQAVAEADKARERAAAVAARIQQAEADYRAGQVRIAIIARMQRAQTRRLAARQEPIVRLTAALQQIARRSPVMALVQPGSMADAVHRRIILTRILPEVMARTKGLRAELARSAELRASAEAAALGLSRTRDALAERRKELAVLEQQRRLASRNLHQSADMEAERALAMGERARDITDLMSDLRDASTVRDELVTLPGPRLRPALPDLATLPASVDDMKGASLSDGAAPPYRLPVVGDVVTGFGELSASGIRAKGLTLATTAQATIVAPAAGRIVFAGPFKGYGQIVILDHGGGWTTLVTGAAQLSATVGDQVRQGDPIGAAGPGRPRITIELRRQDRPIDIGSLL